MATNETKPAGRTGIMQGTTMSGIFFIVIILCSIPHTSCAFKQKDLDKLMTTKQCEWCDLRNADLSGAQLSGAQLSGAALSNANLSNANLSGANLSNAVLSNANLSNADLSGAYMRSTYMYGANLSGANLSKANLDKANLREAELSGANLFDVSLSETIWRNGSRCLEGSAGGCKGDPSRSNTTTGKGIGF
ncbi:MAG: pentapeptide repeat-containing protein [Syntrophorhabdaceae bacterium]|nr:pentapeptide repeat-containing protein [Syntrophorhabdaceae bacterium]MDD5242886.1 pentapeptide repeat-containing protein [Syntrophorhabdaceae bacterium]